MNLMTDILKQARLDRIRRLEDAQPDRFCWTELVLGALDEHAGAGWLHAAETGVKEYVNRKAKVL